MLTSIGIELLLEHMSDLVDMTGVDWNQIMLYLKRMGMIYSRLNRTEARVTY